MITVCELIFCTFGFLPRMTPVIKLSGFFYQVGTSGRFKVGKRHFKFQYIIISPLVLLMVQKSCTS